MKYRKLIDGIIVLSMFIVVIKLGFEFFVGAERKHKYIPHIDTRFAKDFSMDNWHTLKLGDNKYLVNKLLGYPLDGSHERISSNRPKGCFYEEHYSHDGKYGYADFAWQSFNVYYDTCYNIMALDTTWWYD